MISFFAGQIYEFILIFYNFALLIQLTDSMLNIILVDNHDVHTQLLPLTFTRPVSALITGVDSIADKWQRALKGCYSVHTVEYLSELFPTHIDPADNLFIHSHILPSAQMVAAVATLKPGEVLRAKADGSVIAWRGVSLTPGDENGVDFDGELTTVTRPYDLFLLCGAALEADFKQLSAEMNLREASSTNTIIGSAERLAIARTARVEGAFLNTSAGPIIIDEGAEVMEGSCLRGPIYIGRHATVNMGARIYGATSIGEHCKVGGEINNAVIFPYSNKAHDGFLGNAVVGSWCNLGAGCVASNLKNDYTEIKLWDYASHHFRRTGLQFCGLIMGDHSKAGINTMFNTATMVGVGVNIHGTGFPRNFVPSFSEGSAGVGFSEVGLKKFFAIAERVMARRNIELTEPMRRLFEHIVDYSQQFKN